MKQIVRWWVAALATVTTFALSTWICGALVLPAVMKDPAVRWGVAAGLGVAMAALAALWGHSYATHPPAAASHDGAAGPAGNTVTASGPGSISVGGNASGTLSTGTLSTGGRTPGQRPPTEPAPTAAPTPAPPGNAVTASGDRSIAVGGDVTGTASTGDDHDGPRP